MTVTDEQTQGTNADILERTGIEDISQTVISLYNSIKELPKKLREKAEERQKRSSIMLLGVELYQTGEDQYHINEILGANADFSELFGNTLLGDAEQRLTRKLFSHQTGVM